MKLSETMLTMSTEDAFRVYESMESESNELDISVCDSVVKMAGMTAEELNDNSAPYCISNISLKSGWGYGYTAALNEIKKVAESIDDSTVSEEIQKIVNDITPNIPCVSKLDRMFLTVNDIEEEGNILKIQDVYFRDNLDRDGFLCSGLVCRMDNDRDFLIGRENAKSISKIAGTGIISNWVGIDILVYPTTITTFGETHTILRVADPDDVNK